MDFLIFPFLTSLFITILITPLTIIFAKKFNLVDDPKKRPHPAHIQQRIVPRAGGIPIFLGLFFSMILFVQMDKHIVGIILGSLLLLAVGLLDDALNYFSPYLRLLLQLVAAGIVVASGIGITFITNPMGGVLRLDQIVYPIYIFGMAHRIILIADIFAFIWIVWMMNIINWSKGVDGQMPGIITVAALTIGYLSFKLYMNGDPNQFSIAVLSMLVAGSALGFLLFNWFPARIFPGFSGSTILGFMIAVLSILSGAKLATALLVLLVPSVDFLYTFSRRILSGKSPFVGDQKHLHHLLLNRGFSHRQISLLYIATCAILGLLSTILSTQGKVFTAVGVGVILVGAFTWLHLFYKESHL